jgi:hypothetical protein
LTSPIQNTAGWCGSQEHAIDEGSFPLRAAARLVEGNAGHVAATVGQAEYDAMIEVEAASSSSH